MKLIKQMLKDTNDRVKRSKINCQNSRVDDIGNREKTIYREIMTEHLPELSNDKSLRSRDTR